MARKKRSTKVEHVETPSEPEVYQYHEPEIVEPKMKNFGAMRKDAGAGIVKFMKITAIRDRDNVCTVKVKSGSLGHKIATEENGPFEDFIEACAEAEKLFKNAKEQGFKVK